MSLKTVPALKVTSDDAPAQISFLRGLTPEDVHLILAAGKFRRFSARCGMTRQGQPADNLLLLWKGRGRYFFDTQNGKKLNLRPITPGIIFGGAALVSGNAAYLLSSEALKDSVALVWEGATIRAFAKRFHLLLENALLLALDHFTWYTSAYASLSSQTARERLAHVLVTLTQAMGQKVLGGLELDLTNEELADSANITPYTASRIVSEWKKMGALRKQRGKILLHAPDRLLLGIG
jgi:CRP-like cAMP-binding protein